MHFPMRVLPVPGGPKRRIPLGGRRRPVNISGRSRGQTTASFIAVFADSRPAMSSHVVARPLSIISERISSTIFGSMFLRRSSISSTGFSGEFRAM